MAIRFDDVYNEYKEMVFNYVFWRINDYDEAVDLTQEIFIKIYKNLGKFKGESSMKTWVMSIAINHLNDFFRKKKKFNPVYFEEIAREEDYDDPGPIEEMDLEDTIKVERALQKLKDWEREILTLYYMEGFQYEEISKLLNIPLGTVKSRLNSAKKSLKKVLTGGVTHGK
jgi:RNA polymerase sigma-70 factor (ECF subfamily)